MYPRRQWSCIHPIEDVIVIGIFWRSMIASELGDETGRRAFCGNKRGNVNRTSGVIYFGGGIVSDLVTRSWEKQNQYGRGCFLTGMEKLRMGGWGGGGWGVCSGVWGSGGGWVVQWLGGVWWGGYGVGGVGGGCVGGVWGSSWSGVWGGVCGSLGL